LGQEQENEPAIGFEVSPESVSAHVSEGTLARLGDAVAWLVPKRAAKVKITAALADRVATKIQSGDSLDDQEQYFIGLVFKKEARKLANQEAAAQRVREVLPEVQERVQLLPPYEDRGTSRIFVDRAETIAAEISDDEIRKLFAQVLAGELCRPGSSSLKTLETIRILDPNVASLFERLRAFAFDFEWICDEGPVRDVVKQAGIGPDEIMELDDAGLVSHSHVRQITIGPSKEERVAVYGDRQLRIRTASTPTQAIHAFSSLRLTSTGCEIARVLEPQVDAEYFVAVGQWLSNLLGANAVVDWRREPSKEWIAFKGKVQG
jgi:hypothetical protein